MFEIDGTLYDWDENFKLYIRNIKREDITETIGIDVEDSKNIVGLVFYAGGMLTLHI